jgi:hypothetical protein
MGLVWVLFEALWNSKFERASLKLQAHAMLLLLALDQFGVAHCAAIHSVQFALVHSTLALVHFASTHFVFAHSAFAHSAFAHSALALTATAAK